MYDKYNKTYKCSKCGQKYDPHLLDGRKSKMKPIMMGYEVCYDCAFWINFFQQRKYKKPDYEIVNGIVYVVNNIPKDKFGMITGKEAYFIHADGTRVRYNDVWTIGRLTLPFRKKYPDTAQFLSKKLYQTLENNHDFHCQARGCFDRYNCMMYHPEELEVNGPFNEIPGDWKIGNEHCSHFANRKEITTSID